MKTRILTGLLLGSFFLSNACNSRKKDNDTYMLEPGGAAENATAADQAETTATKAGSTGLIILNDSLEKENK